MTPTPFPLEGLKGDDYLEGGRGYDTYVYQTQLAFRKNERLRETHR